MAADPQLTVWCFTAVELASAMARRRREGSLNEEQREAARQRLQALEAAWIEVDALDGVRSRAKRLLEVHPLRAADALQLAAALVLFEERTAGAQFVSLDGNLREAALREGFTILP